MPSQVKVMRNGDGSWRLEDEQGTELETGFKTKKAAQAALAGYADTTEDPDDDAEREDEGEDEETEEGEATEEKSEHNPHGLSIHQRFAGLVEFLKHHGFHYNEAAHPAQNSQTAPNQYARKQTEGINSLPANDAK